MPTTAQIKAGCGASHTARGASPFYLLSRRLNLLDASLRSHLEVHREIKSRSARATDVPVSTVQPEPSVKPGVRGESKPSYTLGGDPHDRAIPTASWTLDRSSRERDRIAIIAAPCALGAPV
jgi:hypothetical protein